MKAAQSDGYSKEFRVAVRDIPVPEPSDNEVLIRVEAAAVNPLDILVATGSVRLIQDYAMPLTLGNECSGIVEKTGRNVREFKRGDCVYTRLPLGRIGAFAEFVAVDSGAVAPMPHGYGFDTASAIPLTGLTAWQGIVEVLEAKSGETLLITGGSGSFGQMAVPVAVALGLRVIVTGNGRARERFVGMGVDRYIDYTKENYWEELSGVDHVIDTLGAGEFGHELSVLRRGGKLLSLRTGPNLEFALRCGFPWYKMALFAVAGLRYDLAAGLRGKNYRFIFVHSDGAQLRRVTEIVERNGIVPAVDPHLFSIGQVNEAMHLVAEGRIDGKVIIRF